MKTYNRLFNQICSFENLLLAARKAQDGKRFQEAVARFNFHLEPELYRLQEELQTRTYRPCPYHEFHIYEPKLRKISAAPYRDRVVHHALCNVIEPIFDRTFIFDSYACRKGKGTHKAVDRFTEFCRKSDYVLKCDIKKYFPSIDHGILKTLFRRKIRDTNVLWLMDLVVDFSNPQEGLLDEQGMARAKKRRNIPSPDEGADTVGETSRSRFPLDSPSPDAEGTVRRRGIPIGNLTSQFYANIYLNGFDHFVKETLKCRHYIRYVDDFVWTTTRRACIKSKRRWRHTWRSISDCSCTNTNARSRPPKREQISLGIGYFRRIGCSVKLLSRVRVDDCGDCNRITQRETSRRKQ